MFRRMLNTVIETTLNAPQELVIYPSPFNQSDITHLNWLCSVTPCFPVKSSNVSILHEPQEFYKALVEKCSSAQKRITLASLYLGTGSLEDDLVKAMSNNKHFINGILKINILLDYTRGSRFTNNSRTALIPLLKQNDRNCSVSLYHTPVLRGLRKKLAPNRWNELFGLQHMKLYIFDDTLIISGANLSNDYFTNRQDRYFMITDKNLCDFYCGLVRKVQNFSLKLDKSDNVALDDGWTQLPYEGNKNKFIGKAGELIENYVLDARDEQNSHIKDGYGSNNRRNIYYCFLFCVIFVDTWVFPLVQMGQLGIEQDAAVTDRILAEAPEDTHLYIATGYFNLTHQYMQTLIYYSRAKCNLLMAHPNVSNVKYIKLI